MALLIAFQKTAHDAEARVVGAVRSAVVLFVMLFATASLAAAQEAFYLETRHVDEMLYLAGVEIDPKAAEVTYELTYELYRAYRMQAGELEATGARSLRGTGEPPSDPEALKAWQLERARLTETTIVAHRALRRQFAADVAVLIAADAAQLESYVERQAQLSHSISVPGEHVDLLRPWLQAGQLPTAAFRKLYAEYISHLSTVLRERDAYRNVTRRSANQSSPVHAASRLDGMAKQVHDEYQRRLADQLQGTARVRFEDAFLAARYPMYFGNSEADRLLARIPDEPEEVLGRRRQWRDRLHTANYQCIEAENRLREARERLRMGRSAEILAVRRNRAAARAQRDRVIKELVVEISSFLAIPR